MVSSIPVTSPWTILDIPVVGLTQTPGSLNNLNTQTTADVRRRMKLDQKNHMDTSSQGHASNWFDLKLNWELSDFFDGAA